MCESISFLLFSHLCSVMKWFCLLHIVTVTQLTSNWRASAISNICLSSEENLSLAYFLCKILLYHCFFFCRFYHLIYCCRVYSRLVYCYFDQCSNSQLFLVCLVWWNRSTFLLTYKKKWKDNYETTFLTSYKIYIKKLVWNFIWFLFIWERNFHHLCLTSINIKTHYI